MSDILKPIYEVTCQKRGCKNTVTGIGEAKDRTCFECKRKQIKVNADLRMARDSK